VTGTPRNVLCVGSSSTAVPLVQALRASGWEVHFPADLRGAHRSLAEHPIDVGLLFYADIDELLCAELDVFLTLHGRLEWVGCFGDRAVSLPGCRDLILTHLFDHHTLPIDVRRLIDCLGHAHGRASLRRAAAGSEAMPSNDLIVGRSPAITELLRQTRRIARVEAAVLVCGESGSGKELIAHLLHHSSARASGPFVALNCGSIQGTLVQSELFGHERGAFTGAVAEKRGLFETANGGTLFLDEIGDLPLDQQVNLLRFLQEGTINRVGSARSLKLDVRVVAATNVDLEAAVARGTFRQDLYYRLNVLPLHVLPLRERREDIEVLALHFFERFRAEKSPRLKGFSRAAISAMEAYSWPGNVRELINRLRRAMVMAERRLIVPADLGLDHTAGVQFEIALNDARSKAERHAIASTLQRTGQNIASAARQLGISRMTLYRLMDKHGIHIAR
jgi:DNA-binding NtrC family response regulator